MRTTSTLPALIVVGLLWARQGAAQRRLEPEDLFRIERIGQISWAPDGKSAAVETPRPRRWLDASIPSAAIAVVDVVSGTLTTVSPADPKFVGFFGAAWSPNARTLAFLSLDTNAIVRPWIWNPGAPASLANSSVQLHDALADRPVVLWGDSAHVIVIARDSGASASGPLYFTVNRGRNVADAWRRAREGGAAVTIVDSRETKSTLGPSRLVSIDVHTGSVRALARGSLHRPRLSEDGRTLTFNVESPPLTQALVQSFFGPEARGDAAYDLPNWGGEVRHVDSRTGVTVPSPNHAPVSPALTQSAELRLANDAVNGSALLLVRAGRSDLPLWRGNEWLRQTQLGRSELIRYSTPSGDSLNGWILYPPRYAPGQPIPVVVSVYPGTVYGRRTLSAADVFREWYAHPQLFAARGYAVVFPSMPYPERPLLARGLDSLTLGVLPLLDTLVARGIADSNRIALIGQSAGGFATLGLITQTNRFRTAIATAAPSNLLSFYGTFYGQYRYGDSGVPQHGQVLRMLHFERAFHGAEAPPWKAPERYLDNSPILRAANVCTPLLLIHGDGISSRYSSRKSSSRLSIARTNACASFVMPAKVT